MQESGEMYLETILVLGKSQDTVRAVDIAEEMDFSKASVSRAIARLKTDNCIIVDQEGRIALTEKGRLTAEKIFERHQILSKFISNLGVSTTTASEDACRIEHYISDETFNAIKESIQKSKKQSTKQPNKKYTKRNKKNN